MISLVHIGEHIIHFDQLPSTNAYAADLLSSLSPAEGTVISTADQYAGKGQLTNTWESEANKNISLSVILYPSFLKVQKQFSFNQAVSIAIFHTIEAYAPRRVHIKWPNDIYIDNKKVAGVLIQNQIQGQVISNAVVGIGINVNQEVFNSDAPNPISLIHVLDQPIDLENLRMSLFENLTSQYQSLRLGAYEQLNHTYHEHLYRKGTLSRYLIKNETLLEGEIIGVNETGLLQLLVDGHVHLYNLKEIQYV